MSPESFIINVLITCEGLSPYSARTVTETWLNGSLSLDKPITRSHSKLIREATGADVIPANNPSPEDIAIQTETVREIRKLAETSGLTDQEMAAFDLRFFRDCSLQQIARFLGSENRQQARNLIRKGLEKIRANPKSAKVFGLETG